MISENPRRVKIDVKYSSGHVYAYEYIETEFFCPICGEKAVWVEVGPGDFYEGPDYICHKCGGGFALPHGKTDFETDDQIIVAINRAV